MTFKYSKRYTVQNIHEGFMARPGVTYLDVAKTAIQLVEQKIYPSIEEIRKALGTGSNSTINKYLREWRSKHGNQAELEQGLPESLVGVLALCRKKSYLIDFPRKNQHISHAFIAYFCLGVLFEKILIFDFNAVKFN